MYRANLECLDPQIIKLLKEFPETPVPLEHDVRVQGLKNPICLVILGFSTTRVLEEVFKSSKDIRHVVVIEPDLSIFHQTIMRFYVAPYLKDERIDFLLGTPLNELRPQLFKIMSNFHAKLGARPSVGQSPEVIFDPFVYGPGGVKPQQDGHEMTRAVIDTAKQIFLSMGCSSDGFNRWEQVHRNEVNILEKYNIQGQFDKFKLLPAIVVGAGPSMDDFIEYYKTYNLGEKAVIIACDAAMKRFVKEGIKPHFVTRCERKLTTIFDGVNYDDTQDVFYCGYPWCPPEYFDLFQESFILYRNNGVCKWTGISHGEVNGGVSAANAALELAWLLGCPKIYLTGIDLCFLDGKSHVPGTEVEFDIKKSEPKWTKIKANNGDEVTTIPVWYRCLNEYENAIAKYKSKGPIEIFNTSERGAVINGTTVVPWSKLKGQFQSKFRVVEIIRNNLQLVSEEEKNKYISIKHETIKELQKVQKSLYKLFLFLEDSMTNSLREEHKIMGQLKAHHSPHEFWDNVETLKGSLAHVYENSCRQVDNFKFENYSNKFFTDTVLDMCQLDLFTMDNKANSLKNLMKVESERMKTYITLHHNLYRLFDYYLKEITYLLQGNLVAPNPLQGEILAVAEVEE